MIDITRFFGKKLSKKEKQNEVIARSRKQGKLGELSYEHRVRWSGNHVAVRTGRGHDYKLYKRDFKTGKLTFVGYREIKTGNAKLSPLQKETQAKKSKYKVIREKV